jgi:hypothetical protein
MLSKGPGQDVLKNLALTASEQRSNLTSAHRGLATEDEVRSPLMKEAPHEARAPAPKDRRSDARHLEETKLVNYSGNTRLKSAVLRRPIATAIGSIILATALLSGYIYWDFASLVSG